MTEIDWRAVDRELAERLFGLEFLGAYSWRWGDNPTQLAVRRKSDGRAMLLPRYSGTWEGMGKVIEAMRARGWAISIGVDPDDSPTCAWADFASGTITDPPVGAYAATIQSAAAVAAVRALDPERARDLGLGEIP